MNVSLPRTQAFLTSLILPFSTWTSKSSQQTPQKGQVTPSTTVTSFASITAFTAAASAILLNLHLNPFRIRHPRRLGIRADKGIDKSSIGDEHQALGDISFFEFDHCRTMWCLQPYLTSVLKLECLDILDVHLQGRDLLLVLLRVLAEMDRPSLLRRSACDQGEASFRHAKGLSSNGLQHRV